VSHQVRAPRGGRGNTQYIKKMRYMRMRAYVNRIGRQWFVVEEGKARPQRDRWSALIMACALNAR
jgi:hypothetical protein